MKIRRIFAGALAALLLCVPALAAACDLSCGFSLFTSDCHSAEIAARGLDSPDTAMGGMSMPEMADADRQMPLSAQRAMPIHAVLVDMGACSRHSCDQAQALASNADQRAPHVQIASRIAGFDNIEILQIAFHDARDGIAPPSPAVHNSLQANLRV
jgi:hypothetical protein